MSEDSSREEERGDDSEPSQHPEACLVIMAGILALMAALSVVWFMLQKEPKTGSTTALDPRGTICRNLQCGSAVQMLKDIMKPEVNPCDDFYSFVCGNYKHSSGQVLIQMDDEMYRTLVRSLDSGWSYPSQNQSPAQKAGALYKNCIESPAEETQSLMTFVQSLGLGLTASTNAKALDKIIMLFFKYNIVTLLGMFLDDAKLSHGKRQLVLTLSLAHLIWLKQRSKYTRATEFYLAHMLAFGLDPRTIQAFLWMYNVIHMENTATSIIFNPETLKMSQVTVFSTVELLQNYTPSISTGRWASLISEHSGGVYKAEDEVQVNLGALSSFDQLHANLGEELSLLIAWELVRTLMPFSSRKIAASFYRKEHIISKCLSAVLQAMQVPLLSLYLSKAVPQSTLRAAREMTNDIRESIMEEIENSTWLDSPTKTTAINKVRVMDLHVGYPTYFRSEKELSRVYQSYPDVDNNFLEPWLDAMSKTIAWQITNQSSFYFSVTRTNAAYIPYRNKMVLPASTLRPPLFSPALPKAINYASLGGIIGHEITHAFDLQGSLVDAQGRWDRWWSNRSWEQHAERVLCLRRSHGANDGEADCENMADFSGIVSAHEAFVSHGDRRQLAELKYDAKQLFFIASCTKWCATSGVIQAKQYSPFVQRCNVPLKNMKAFAEAFKCPNGAAMSPSSRCSFW